MNSFIYAHGALFRLTKDELSGSWSAAGLDFPTPGSFTGDLAGTFWSGPVDTMPDGNLGVGMYWGTPPIATGMAACTLPDGSTTAGCIPCPQAVASLAVLPTTTRWKPQRSDTPIVVDFSGPEDLNLDSGTLEISGPVGPMTVVGPITPTSVGGPFTYRMEWNGPWTYVDPAGGEVKRLPRGNYPITVRGTAGTAPDIRNVASAEYPKVSLVEVAAVTVQKRPGAPELDSNPSTHGGGRRMFAEATDPIDVDPNRLVFDQVDVHAILQPPVFDPGPLGPVTVYFRSFDVDDPATAYPVDLDGDVPPDFVADNRLAPQSGLLTDPTGIEVAGTLGVALPAAANGIATTALRTSRFPGDNYVVAASTSQAWLGELGAIQPSATGEIRYTSGPVLRPEETGQVSELLAVWRTLHVPLERMDHTITSQKDLELQSVYSSMDKGLKTLRDSSVNFLSYTTPDTVVDHPLNNDWRGAQLADTVTGSAALVTGNGSHHVNTATPMTLTDNQQRYRLFDDELAHLSDTTHDTSSILVPVLWPLYVQVDTLDPPQYRPFERYVDTATQRGWIGVHFNDDVYWSVPLVLAFDHGLDGGGAGIEDHDPGDNNYLHETGLFGLVPDLTSQPVAAVFTETIHDYKETNSGGCQATVTVDEFLAGTQAHEVLHGLRVNHGGDLSTGVLMCSHLKNDASQPVTVRWQITPEQRAGIRGLVRPDMFAFPEDDSCPCRPGCNVACSPLALEEGDLP